MRSKRRYFCSSTSRMVSIVVCLTLWATLESQSQPIDCGKPIQITKSLLDHVFSETQFTFTGLESDGVLLPFVVASTGTHDFGVVLFVKGKATWRAHTLALSASSMGVYHAPKRPHAVIFTGWSVESFAGEYDVIRTTDGFATFSCGTIPRPVTPTATGIVDFIDFNMASNGKGTFITQAETVPDGPADRYYRSVTKDGTHWSQRIAIEPPVSSLRGIYERVETKALPLVEELRNYGASLP